MHVTYGLVAPLASKARGKRERYAAYADRAVAALDLWKASRPDLAIEASAAQRLWLPGGI
jgi:methylenetetrahydrofolate--tRNA-(uracil-5-)-methyltransferase